MNTNAKTYRLVIRAALVALIALQTMVPMLGYIPLGFMSLTIIHITVIIAAVLFGPWDGMFVGLVWGLMTMVRAYAAPTTPLDTMIFTNPIVAVVPRVLVGLVAAWTFRAVYKLSKRTITGSIAAAITGTLTNTILVMSLMAALYTNTMAKSYHVAASGLTKVIGTIILTNGIPETIGAIIITPLIVKAVSAAAHLKPWRTAL